MNRQDTFVKTQVRLPENVHQELLAYAEQHNISMNGTFIELLQLGLAKKIKILKVKKNYSRLVHGALVETFDLDYSKDLTSLKKDVEFSLSLLMRSSKTTALLFANKKVRVHQGSNHIDIVNDGVGSLNWLTVEDHWINED